MQDYRLDLDDLLPLWQQKLSDSVDQSITHRLRRRNVDLAMASRGEDLLRNSAALTQDVVGAIIIRQRRIQR